MNDETIKPGYRNPPVSTRFKPGQSGNLRGRPPNRHRDRLPYDEVLDQQVIIKVDGVRSQMTMEEAFLRKMAVSGLSRDSLAATELLDALEEARLDDSSEDKPELEGVVWEFMDDQNANDALEQLRMAKPRYRDQPNAHMAIEPWLVQKALARFGDRRLTREQQKIVLNATRTPRKVSWPDWWEVLP